jgi:hypothetical protein
VLINRLLGQSCQRTHSMADDGRCCTYQVSEPQVRNSQPIELMLTA